MKFRIQVLRMADDGAERMKEVMEFERQELAMETLGMSLAEGRAVLKGVQEFVAEQQAAEFLQRERTCRHCARHLSSKGAGSTSVRTVSGQCGCRTHAGIMRLSVDRERELSTAPRPAVWANHS
jgi:hypothetical protein